MPRLGRFTHGSEPMRVVYGAGWTSGVEWQGAENLAPIGFGSSDHTSSSESLSRLRYPSPQTDTNLNRHAEIQTQTHTTPQSTYDGNPLGLPSFIQGRKGSRMLVGKIQNKCAMVTDGFVFMYMLNPVIGSTEQKTDLCYTM
jgi:hypothetical protein